MRLVVILTFVLSSVVSFAQDIKLNAPTNLKAELESKNGKYFVHLTWDGRQPGDTLTESYFIFNNYPPKETLYLNGVINRINETECLYEIKKPYAAEYLFAVRADAYFPYKYKSDLSDTVSIVVPSTMIPAPNQLDGTLNGSVVSVSWTYQELLDLAGFEITVDGETSKLKSTDRSFKVDLEKEIKNGVMVKIVAYSETGVKSAERSKILLVK